MFESLPPRRGYRWNPVSRRWVSIRGERALNVVVALLVIAACVVVVWMLAHEAGWI